MAENHPASLARAKVRRAMVVAVALAPAIFAGPGRPDAAAAEPNTAAALPWTGRNADPGDVANSKGLVRLSPKFDVWVDAKRKRVVMLGEVALRKGFLELFACLKGTKEHESIVSIDTSATLVHTALLAVGAEAGHPVKFRPKYRPARGTRVEVLVFWNDQRGARHHARAQDWVRNSQTKRPLEHDWVFGGSAFWEDEQTGQRFYQAEDGDLICISNFPSALLDLPVKVSQANDSLLFEAWTERIPPLGTKVAVVLVPQLSKPRAEKSGKR